MLSLGFCREHFNFKLRHQAEVKYKHTCLAGWEGRDALGSLLLTEGLLRRTLSVVFDDQTMRNESECSVLFSMFED